ncbi:MAG: peroxiredoxin family protein [Chromatiales bacterium]
MNPVIPRRAFTLSSMRQALRGFCAALLVGVLGALVASGQADPRVQAPDFTLSHDDGEAMTLSNLRGNVVVVVFWATWCPYCKRLLPGIQKLADFYQGERFRVLAVDIWDDGDTRRYMTEHGLSLDVLLNGDRVAEQWGVRGTPTTVVVGADGTIRLATRTSDPDDPQLASVLENAMAEL